jgi:hypothetical protein
MIKKGVNMARNAARMANRKFAYLKDRHNLEDLVVDGRIIVKREFKKQDENGWTGFTWLKVRQIKGSCK